MTATDHTAPGPLFGLSSSDVLGMAPERADFSQRCALAANCLPVAEYRTWLERLHADMLAEIARLRADAMDLRELLRNSQTAVCVAGQTLVLDDMPGQIAEALFRTAYLRA